MSFRCDYGPAEIVQHGTSGLLVAAGDVDALSHAIGRVVTDRLLSASLSVGGGVPCRLVRLAGSSTPLAQAVAGSRASP